MGKETIETFYREVIANKERTAPPCLCCAGVNYYSVRVGSLFFVLTAPDGRKLSKRDGDLNMEELRRR